MTSPSDLHGQAPAGYTTPWVVQPGESVALHAGLSHATQVDIVHLACANAERLADGRPHGPAERITVLPRVPAVIHGPKVQPLVARAEVHAGCVGLPAWAELSLALAVQRMARGTPGHVMSLHDAGGLGVSLELRTPTRRSATLVVSVQPGKDALELALPSGDWLLLVLDLLPGADKCGIWMLRARTTLCRATVPNGIVATWTESWLPASAQPQGVPSQLHMGTRALQQASADLRLDLVSVLPRACIESLAPACLLTCEEDAGNPARLAWEHAALREPGKACLACGRSGKGFSVHDLAQRATLVEPQRPYSGVRGVHWDGRFQGPQQAPAHYTALHFNADTLLDAQWALTTVWRVPEDMDSGSYAFRLRAVDQPQAEPSYVITDHDLHRLGAAALNPYRVVLTGLNPEYTRTAVWDGLWHHLQNGGQMRLIRPDDVLSSVRAEPVEALRQAQPERLKLNWAGSLGLGGNGFYWSTACDEAGDAIEVRCAEDDTWPSISPPGEYHCAFTGEYGGIWRRLGRPPQQIVDLGMAAQGFEHAAHYRQCDDAHAPSWEIDRCDADLDSPEQAWWLARSEGHAESMLRTRAELLSYVPASRVRVRRGQHDLDRLLAWSGCRGQRCDENNGQRHPTFRGPRAIAA